MVYSQRRSKKDEGAKLVNIKFRVYRFINSLLMLVDGIAGIITLGFVFPNFAFKHYLFYTKSMLEEHIDTDKED